MIVRDSFADGEIYTFGRTNYLPELPIVEGWKVCDGSERDLLNCPMSDAITVDHRYDPPSDLDCATSGCVGADGLAGTADDSIDTGLACNHEVDQGAICYEDQEPMDLVMVPKCGNGGTVKWFWNARFDDENTQDIAFGCIDYFTTQVILKETAVSNEGGISPLLVPLPAVSWPRVPAWGSLEPPRRDGENAQKTGENGRDTA